MKKSNLFQLFSMLFLFGAAQRNAVVKTTSVQVKDAAQYKIEWLSPSTEKINETESVSFLNFTGVLYDLEKNYLPYLSIVNSRSGSGFAAEISNIVTQPVTNETELKILNDLNVYISNDFEVENIVREIRKNKDVVCKIVPVRKTKSGGFEKLTAFNLNWKSAPSFEKLSNPNLNSFGTTSVLASGNWYKIGVTQSGVYKIDYAFLQSMGIDPDSINPANIKLFGNGGRMMPESNAIFRPDDLLENAIVVDGEADGVFNLNDYILFYGSSPHYWQRQNSLACVKYRHRLNPYSDTTYYFLTVGTSAGKRVAAQAQSSATPTHTVTTFDDFGYYENNSINLIKTGREWYGEYFDIVSSYPFAFNFQNIVAGDTVFLEASLANRMPTADANAYTVAYPGGSVPLTSTTVSLTNYTAPYAADGTICTNFITSNPNIQITVSKNNASALGWLNYIRVNARRQLIQATQQMSFRDRRSVGTGNVALYSLTALSNSVIWEITDLSNVSSQQFTSSGSNVQFTQAADSLREYIIFQNTGFLAPVYHGRVENQNLHAITQADYVIVSYPDFLPEAQRLADFHQQNDSLSYVIVTPQQCYNEFSSGSQDPVAIREFVRMLYKRAATANDAPKYLLLVGDGSYKYKRSTAGNSNYIPTYQSPQSIAPTGSYTSDDFFGLLDDNEGDFTLDALDLGIGRIPCRTLNEANVIVNKIMNYVRPNGSYSSDVNSCGTSVTGSMGDWRNWICFIGDDEDNDLHVIQSDSLARMVGREHPTYNVNKIFFDAYVQQSTPGGQAYPDVNREIDKQVEKGCLIINYTGHGGELGLAHESVITIPQVQGYTNFNNLPMWFTATCEFSRYDDPDRTSAGEYVLLNPAGGGIALFSTVRLVYATSNFSLSLAMWKVMLDSVAGKIPAMGDVFMLGKQQVYTDANTRNFTLLGDPALKLAYPRQVIHTDSINSVTVTGAIDTLKALSKITIKGHLSDANGNKQTNFNGIIYPVVFDKAASIITLQNDPGSPPFTFKLQKNIIYRGKASVTNGDFSYTFIVPKDISYNYGPGRISYYAHDGFVDATGYFQDAIVGGSDPNASADQNGPIVKLYMNDNKFVSGGTTNADPKIYAEVSDSSGINTVGNGIGHDIVAILDANSNNPIILNDYYQADMNSFQTGKILYGLEDLTEGTHSLSLKVWDVQNNSSTSYADFVVAKSAELALTHVLNYPNPFTTKTQFFLEHNQCCTNVDVVINVFTISGKVVKSINKTLTAQGFRSEGIEWDGKDDFGDKLGKGVYIYKVKIKDEEGKTAEQFEKLVILN